MWHEVDEHRDARANAWRAIVLAAAIVLVVVAGIAPERGNGGPAVETPPADTGSVVAVAPATIAATVTTVLAGAERLFLEPPPAVPHRVARPVRVALFGDSLAVESVPFLRDMLAASGTGLEFDGFGGTATCDYVSSIEARASRPEPLDAVVVLFTGNALTPCITSRLDSERGIVEESSDFPVTAFLAAYEADTRRVIAAFPADVEVILVGVPATRDSVRFSAVRLDDMYRRIALEYGNVRYLSLDRLLTPDGTYRDTLPCMLIEPCEAGQMVPVRHDDGGHLCAPEPRFCFGGFRMAVMISDGIAALVQGPPASADASP